MTDQIHIPDPVIPWVPLSPREIEVMLYIAHGHTIKSTAEALVLSTQTIHSHLGRIFAKLGAHTQAHAVALALRTGQIRVDQIHRPKSSRP